MRNNDDFGSAAGDAQRPPLTDGEKAMLDHERQNPKADGTKLEGVLKTFNMSLTSYYSRLNYLRSHPEAVSYAPDVVRRLNDTVERGSQRTSWRDRA